MINKVILVGRISNELELRYTPNGKAICEFNIAVNRIGSEGTDFLTCVVWNKQAENLVNFQNKGSLIAVEGSNRVDKYKNEQGQNRYKNYVLVNNIQFLEAKKQDNTPKAQTTGTVATKEENKFDPYKDFATEIELSSDEASMELPF
jgi:single-strand DNA-binding protein